MNASGSNRRLATESGQTLTEYSTALGLLVALIIAVTTFLVPGIALVIVRLARHMSVFMTKPVG
jgi:hypothetical protein